MTDRNRHHPITSTTGPSKPSHSKTLPPSINQLVRELGQLKRQELIQTTTTQHPSTTELEGEDDVTTNRKPTALGDFLLMGKNWSEQEDFQLFLGVNHQNPNNKEKKEGEKEYWSRIAKRLPNRTPVQCQLRWEFLNAPPVVKEGLRVTPTTTKNNKREVEGKRDQDQLELDRTNLPSGTITTTTPLPPPPNEPITTTSTSQTPLSQPDPLTKLLTSTTPVTTTSTSTNLTSQPFDSTVEEFKLDPHDSTDTPSTNHPMDNQLFLDPIHSHTSFLSMLANPNPNPNPIPTSNQHQLDQIITTTPSTTTTTATTTVSRGGTNPPTTTTTTSLPDPKRLKLQDYHQRQQPTSTTTNTLTYSPLPIESHQHQPSPSPLHHPPLNPNPSYMDSVHHHLNPTYTELSPKERLLERVVASYTNGKSEARESILAIANLLEQNPQLIPAVRLLDSLITQRPETSVVPPYHPPFGTTPEEPLPPHSHQQQPTTTRPYPDHLDDNLAFIIPNDTPLKNSTHPTHQASHDDTPGYSMEDHHNENLMYRFATQDLPEELEDDGDFIHTENGPDLEYDEKLHVTKRELQSLFEDLEDHHQESTPCKIRKPVKDEDHSGDTLFSLNLLNRIRVQQQQNLQLVLQAYAIEVRFRGVESEKAQYWKSRAVLIKQLNDYGQLQVNHVNSFFPDSPQDDFLTFFHVPGADYMDAMLDTLTHPPDNYNPVQTTKAMSKSRLTAAAITRRDWIELYPESEFCVPNSARNVVDKARVITILINEVFSPIFTRSLQPFFTAAKKRDRPIFTPGEDKLFTIGLYKFGDDWPSIRSHVLPARASRQLENRFNNLKSRRAEFNPVQQYYLRQIKPLDLKEEDLLSQGIQIYGRKFRLISQRLMPNRPSFVLKKAWREMELRKIVLSRPMFLDQYS